MEDKDVDEVFGTLLGASVGWIAAADGKATTMLGFTSAMLAAVSIADIVADNHLPFPKVAAGALVLTLAATIVASFGVLHPRTDRNWLLKRSSNHPLAWSYFGDAASIPLRALVEQITAANRQDFEEQQREQAYIVALIAAKKMWWFKAASYSFSIAFVLFFALLAGHAWPH